MRAAWIRRAAAGATLLVALACGDGEDPAVPNPVARENALHGDDGWRLRQRAAPGQLEGYADATSVNHGEPVHVHVRADAAHTLAWKLYRMGWYGGAEGRLVTSGGPAAVGPQPVPAPSPDTGIVECRWSMTFIVETDRGWASGIYLVAMTRDDGPQSYVIFVVRADERRGAAVFQSSVTTYQAYNAWGGKSLYPPWSPRGPSQGNPAVEVSFDRPYEEGSGSGQYFRYEHDAVKWAESRGFDLVYVTNVDLDRDPSLLASQRLFLSVGHDEYWSAPARDAVERAVAAGVSAAFLSGNSIFWQIRLEPSRSSGAPRRTVVCYKKTGRDPLRGTPLETGQWRDPPVNRPENALLGVLFTCWVRADAPWIVANAGHWLYAGTGVRDGDAIPGIVGYETDRRSGDPRYPTPEGTEVVARSPVTDVSGRQELHEAVVRSTPAGGFVFAAGTIELAWGLAHDGYADGRVQRLVENVLRRAGLDPANERTLAPAP